MGLLISYVLRNFLNKQPATNKSKSSIIYSKALKGLKYLILDCLKFEKHTTHFNLDDALFVHHNLKPKKTILTNLNFDLDYNFLLKRLPKNVLPAYDGLKLNL